MHVVVLGAGGGASAMAVDLATRGFEVTLCSTYPPDIPHIALVQRKGGIEYIGTLGEGFASIAATSDITCVSKARVVVLVTLAAGHQYYAAELAGLLKRGQDLLLNPGYLGGMLRVARLVGKKDEKVGLWETNNLPYVCRLQRPGQVNIVEKSRLVLVSAFPGNLDESQAVSDIYPQSSRAENVLETGMMNPNIVVHPPGTVLNSGWIEATDGGFYFYREGLTERVCRIVEEVDTERLEICRRLGIKTMTLPEYYRSNGYTSSAGKSVHDVFARSEPNRYLRAPSSLKSRYITEDVPFGLVPLASLGKVAGVRTQVTNSIIDLASALTGSDFVRDGMNANKMGIDGITSASLTRLVTEGVPRHQA